jgi:hypothetical protein
MEKITFLTTTTLLFLGVNYAQSTSYGIQVEYISRDPAVCQSILFLCEEGKMPFYNDEGCGCMLSQPPIDHTVPTPIPEPVPVEEEICTEEYRPVCGVISVQCFQYPCENVAQTFPNRCYAERAGATHIQEGPC